MRANQSLIVELDDAIRRGSRSRRAETLRRVTDLFLAQAGRFTAERVALFDDVMGRLTREIEQEALTELGRRLAPLADAPAQMLCTLAHNDAIAVAGPVLARAARLADPELADIARSKGQAHLLAISRRRALGPALGDLLVSRGNRYVKRSLAANETARLSDEAYGALAASAKEDATLAARIVRRADVPPGVFRALIGEATDAVRARLVAAARPERHAEIHRILDRVAGGMAAAVPSRDYGAAVERLRAQYPDGKMPEGEVLRLALPRDLTATVAALSLVASIPPELVEKLIASERVEPVLILCRAVRFAWPAARAVIHVRPAPKPSPQALTAACDDFNRLSPAAARQMLRYWRGQSSVVSDQ